MCVSLWVSGWLLTWVGLQLLTGPLTIFPDIIPFVGPCIGDLMGAALCCVTLMVSLASSLFVGAIAWIFVRPLLSLTLIVFCIALAAGTYYTRQNKGALTGEKAAASKSLPIAQSVPVPQCSPGMEVDVMVPPGCVQYRRDSSRSFRRRLRFLHVCPRRMVSGQLLSVDPDGPQGPLQPVQVRIPPGKKSLCASAGEHLPFVGWASLQASAVGTPPR